MNKSLIKHYDSLIDENNDPLQDTPALRAYMDKWDGQAFFEMLALSSNQKVLEIGCGTGRLAVRVAPVVSSFFGIDISPKTVERAKKYLSFPNVTLICGDFLNYPFDTVFDLIYSSLTFMHIKEKRQAIEKIYSLLSPSGRFVLSIDKNQSDILDYGKRSLKLYPDDPKKIHSILFSAGFSNIQTRETEFAYLFSAEKK